VSWPDSPAWLTEFQARFSALLRTPLDRATGSLLADTSRYAESLVGLALPSATLGSAERLAIYHRQYWFRLFTILQGLYPLTARLVGYWRFNDFASKHLLWRPPRGYDIEAIADEFEASLAAQLPETGQVASDSSLEAAAVLEAARTDAAFLRVARAPRGEPFRPGPGDTPRFADSCLLLSNSVALLREHWPLAELRLRLIEHDQDSSLRLGDRRSTPCHWLLSHQSGKLGLLALEAREAELFELLQRLPLQHALGRLEVAAPPEERASLPERAQAWLARSVRLGLWQGFVSPGTDVE